MTPSAKKEAIQELANSAGWQLVKGLMEQELRQALRDFSSVKTAMPIEEIHFRRGAMWAAENLLNLPQALLHRYENEAMMEKAKALSELPATAGN